MLLKNLAAVIRLCRRKISTNVRQVDSRDVWRSVVGLEIHAQLSTETKLFSSAPAVFGASANSTVSLFDAAIPGTLPTLNKRAVELAIISSLAFGCKINPVSYFDRKHYFYCDLPAGYQITQQRLPLAWGGEIEYAVYQPGIQEKLYYKTSKIKQVQLEQDSGKSLHEYSENRSYVDLNRAGVALIEIVFHPDIENEEEACALVKEVIKILERAGSCSCHLEEGALRVDANISVHKSGDELGVRTEIKNISSVHGLRKAISYEIKRHIDIITSGGKVKNETLCWNHEHDKTTVMRDKEENLDYRYMPETNLPPLRLIIDDHSEQLHRNIKSKGVLLDFRYLKDKVPKTPQSERIFLIENYGLNDMLAYNLVNQDKLLDYFKEIMLEKSSRNPKVTYLLLMYQLLNALKNKDLGLDKCSVAPNHLGQIIDLVQTRRISKRTSDNLIEELLKDGNSLTPIEIVEKNNLVIISNPKELRKICLRIFEREEAAVISYKRKKKKAIFNYLVDKILEETNFRADTQVLPQVMIEVLNEFAE